MYTTAVHPDTFKLMLVPFRRMPMHGGVNAHDIVQSLFLAFDELLKVKNKAFDVIRKNPDFENCADVPQYFKLGNLECVNNNKIHIKMSERLPIANCGDGVGVNVKAARVGSQLYDLSPSSLRCG